MSYLKQRRSILESNALCLKPTAAASTGYITYRCRCFRCKNWFLEYHRNYHKNNDHKRREQLNLRSKRWRQNNAEKAFAIYLKCTYKISLEQYKALLEKQTNVCAICFKVDKRRLCVDHSHKTGKVRGLLCDKCNKGLGQFNDSHQLISRASQYLVSHE